MVTLRTYSNPAEAALAKSLLDDHKIPCSLADENANLYGGGPLAMPIRLLVPEDRAQEAARVLDSKGEELPEDFDPAPAVETQPSTPDISAQILSEVRGVHYTNQWILLVSIGVLILAVYLVFEIPRHTSPWSAVGEAMRHYKYDQALVLTKKIVQQHPEDYYAHEYLGYVYLQMGNLNQAELEYTRASELAPRERLKAKAEEIHKRIERESRPQSSPTPIPWP
jgi:tetratricopeptide (TPR) repeat protein